MTTQQSPTRPSTAARATAWRCTRVRDFIWLAWRQHGGLIVTSVLVTAAVCAALFEAHTLLHPIHCRGSVYNLSTGREPADGCGNVAAQHTALFSRSLWLLRASVVLPALVAVFWGAPLVAREHENGTAGLAWGQSMSARKWLRGKLIVLGGFAILLGVPLWLCARLVAADLVRLAPWEFGGAFGWEPFATLAPLIPVYAVAALTLGVLSSLVLRKTLPAMLLAAAVTAGLGMGVAQELRPHYLPATTVRYPGSAHGPTGIPDNALYLVDNTWADAKGNPRTSYPVICNPDNDACLAAHGISGRITIYIPANEEADFQLIEAALCLVLTAGLGLAATRLIRP
jgi:hypothetical protein